MPWDLSRLPWSGQAHLLMGNKKDCSHQGTAVLRGRAEVSATAFLANFHIRDAPSADTNSHCGVNERRIVFYFQPTDGNVSSLTSYV